MGFRVLGLGSGFRASSSYVVSLFWSLQGLSGVDGVDAGCIQSKNSCYAVCVGSRARCELLSA